MSRNAHADDILSPIIGNIISFGVGFACYIRRQSRAKQRNELRVPTPLPYLLTADFWGLVGMNCSNGMGLIDRFIKWFKDSAERRRFINEFNVNARIAFQSLSVDTLLEAKACSGNSDDSYRHELSAPLIFSGLAIEAKAGTQIPVNDIILIGKIILSDQILVRRMFVLHWDTLIVRDTRTGKFIDWRIRDFMSFGGLLYERR